MHQREARPIRLLALALTTLFAVLLTGAITSTAQAAELGDRLAPGQAMAAGQWLMSPDRTHGFTLQADGNLVAYGPHNRVLWSADTYGHPGALLRFQSDGNAVVYAADGSVLWHAGTYGNPGADLVVQNDGNVVVYRSNGSAAWYSGWDRAGLGPGGTLLQGQRITSPNGRYWLTVQHDGNVVVYAPGGRPLFSTGAYTSVLTMQTDGRLVADRDYVGDVWWSPTWGEGISRLAVQDDGNVVIYRADGHPTWFTGWDEGQTATWPVPGYTAPIDPLTAAPHGTMPGIGTPQVQSCAIDATNQTYVVSIDYTFTGGIYDVYVTDENSMQQVRDGASYTYRYYAIADIASTGPAWTISHGGFSPFDPRFGVEMGYTTVQPVTVQTSSCS
jgi:hypothetical protein